MDLKNCTSVLFVKDIQKSKVFYCNILGFKIEFDFGGNIIFNNGFAIWEIQKNHIIPSTLGIKNTSDSSVNRFELYFETENLEDIYHTLKSNNVKFLHEIHEEPWGQRTIRFFDPDNHLIEIGESMAQFINRFHEQGLTIEEIAERTNVHVNDVKRFVKK